MSAHLRSGALALSIAIASLAPSGTACAQTRAQAQPAAPPAQAQAPQNACVDAAQEAQLARCVPIKRPEQHKTPHDLDAALFEAANAQPASTALASQPDKGQVLGFDFYRDPLDAKRPGQTAEEIRRQDEADRPKVMAAQQALLEARYDLTCRVDPAAKMSRGKPLCVGPTARLKGGMTYEKLADLSPADIKRQGLFPFPALPHPKQATGGQVFPPMQIEMFPRLKSFDVDFDLPEAFLPEFPPAIFLQSRPELGDVSSPCAASGTARRTSTTAACSRSRTPWSSSTWCKGSS